MADVRSPSKSRLGATAARFLGNLGELRADLDLWIRGGPLPPRTAVELVLYSSCLIVMQRLEAKHHYLHMQVSRGRASSVPATVAELRRQANDDIRSVQFRQVLPQLMKSFNDLVPGPWQSFSDLLRVVYGHGLQQMHPNIHAETQAMAQHLQLISDQKSTGEVIPTMWREHLAECFKKDHVYALPSTPVGPTDDVAMFDVFQVVSLNPAGRMYIQRASALSSDVSRLFCLLVDYLPCE
jgi:hypothetical protein